MVYSLAELKQVTEPTDTEGKESVIDMILRSQAEFYARTKTKEEQEEQARKEAKEKMRAELAAQKAAKSSATASQQAVDE